MAVFHLKYRPKKIADLDLKSVAETLGKILGAKEIPQAFLFAGPKGSGKTSAARIVARALNCLSLEGTEPCGKCENCREIEKGASMDVIEIDAASNRGIDDVRGLKDKAYLLPAKLKRKVIVIDEVHMLTKEAFNALLKLIEEPPTNTFFILCTTDEEKIPETVVSRLVRVGFYRGGKEELMKSAEKIIKGEKLKVEPEAVKLVIEKSDGSFRNLQRTINELVLVYGNSWGVAEVEDYWAKRSGEYLAEALEEDLAKKKRKEILEKMEKMADKGVDFSMVRENWVRFFQGRMVEAVGGKTGILGLPDLVRLIDGLIGAGNWERSGVVDQLPLELAIIKYLGEENKSLETKVERVEAKSEDRVTKKIEEKNKEVDPTKGKIKVEEIQQAWPKILTAVKPYNHSVEAFLRAAWPTRIEGEKVVLEVFYKFHKDKLEEAKNRQIVETGLKEVLGVGLIFDCVLGKEKKAPVVPEKEDKKKDVNSLAEEIFG